MKFHLYTIEEIPSWCQMSHGDHFDGLGGCWGISSVIVGEKGEEHCRGCEFFGGEVILNVGSQD